MQICEFFRFDFGDETVVTVAGKLDAATSSELARIVGDLVSEKRRKVNVNLECLDLIDSCGVDALREVYETVHAADGEVTVTGLTIEPDHRSVSGRIGMDSESE